MLDLIINETKNGTLDVTVNGKRSTGDRSFGGCRKVFIVGDLVFKFDGDDSYSQNWYELDFYTSKIKEGDEKYFAKLLGYGEFNGEFFLVQERVQDTEEEATDDEMYDFLCIQEKYNLQDIDFGETWRRNCALTTEGVKIFDVGVVDNPEYGDDYYGW